ncbi:hypothetical protein C0Q70_18649 [Pomacea canaliculata]|uniref:Uncharacterized protein n=1 Tax=Pomacea canaliculata TaxID=400727 RepID=A0A2T7NH36_POMCA|nr:hypothetical protein C0Q70_18649 [Pomacea canaliculata]
MCDRPSQLLITRPHGDWKVLQQSYPPFFHIVSRTRTHKQLGLVDPRQTAPITMHARCRHFPLLPLLIPPPAEGSWLSRLWFLTAEETVGGASTTSVTGATTFVHGHGVRRRADSGRGTRVGGSRLDAGDVSCGLRQTLLNRSAACVHKDAQKNGEQVVRADPKSPVDDGRRLFG